MGWQQQPDGPGEEVKKLFTYIPISWLATTGSRIGPCRTRVLLEWGRGKIVCMVAAEFLPSHPCLARSPNCSQFLWTTLAADLSALVEFCALCQSWPDLLWAPMAFGKGEQWKKVQAEHLPPPQRHPWQTQHDTAWTLHLCLAHTLVARFSQRQFRTYRGRLWHLPP